MKPLAVLFSIATVAAAATTDDIIPKPFPKDRYVETAKKSPFVLETKAVETEPAHVNPFQNLYVCSVSTADGKDYVLVKRIGEDRPLRFIGNEPGPDGLAVKSVRHGGSFRETKVVMQKDAETGEIGFNEAALTAPPPANAGRGPALPGQFPKPGNVTPQQFQPGRPPQPGAQSVPRPGTAVPMPQPSATQPATLPQPPGTNNNRVRVRTVPVPN
jgi:hypothetical protein